MMFQWDSQVHTYLCILYQKVVDEIHFRIVSNKAGQIDFNGRRLMELSENTNARVYWRGFHPADKWLKPF